MQNIIVSTIIACAMLSSQLGAHSLMPSLDRIRKKVDAALDTRSSQSLKELLAGGHTGVITADKTNTPQNLPDAEKQLADLYWSNQQTFITELTNTHKQSKEQAALLLKSKIKEKYATIKTPLIALAQDLANEELCLQNFSTTLLKLSNTASAKQDARTRLQNLYTKQTQLKASLQQLIGTINSLLIG